MRRSRRLLFVLSPSFLMEKSFSLLECRLGLHLHQGHQAALVAVVYRSVGKVPCAEAVQIRRAAGTALVWRRARSEPRRSHFWLRLRLALPVRPLAAGRRLIDSTSSHSDLAALALQRVQRNQHQNHNDRANQSRTNRRAPPRGRGGWMGMEGWSPHGAGCSGCAGFTGQVQASGAPLTGTQQVSHDRTKSQLDPVPEPTRDPGSTFSPASGPAPRLILS
ncbi:uncharacterized protein ACO6RY_06555 [Pungitius sinensis]